MPGWIVAVVEVVNASRLDPGLPCVPARLDTDTKRRACTAFAVVL
jgi:hypothetical protein